VANLLKFTSVTNPVWGNAEHTQITCTVEVSGAPNPLPFNAMASDPHDYGRELFNDLVAQKYGEIAAYVAPVTPALAALAAAVTDK
jgi:hypothetical protein